MPHLRFPPAFTSFLIAFAAAAAAPRAATGQAAPARPTRGTLQDAVVHGRSLEGNTLGVSADRDVTVYLPPGYASGDRRYPVLYVLHGIMDSPRTWTVPWPGTPPADSDGATIQGLLDRGIAAGRIGPVIAVIVDAEKTCHYTDSPAKGRWTEFVASDLVSWVDARFRTIATSAGRGLLGHSMGGHGAIKVAMLRPGVFGSVYALSPSLMDVGGEITLENAALAQAARIRSAGELEGAGFLAQAVVGVSQCFTPDAAAPLGAALPFVVGADGRPAAGPAYDRWVAQLPVHMAPAHREALASLAGLRFDAGWDDEFAHIPPGVRRLSEVLDSLGVPHTAELYNGGHRDRLWGDDGRLARDVLPWFSRLFAGAPARPAAADATGRSGGGAAVAAAQARLWRASQQGDIPAAIAAVRAGADVNALDTTLSRSGRRPLNYAAESDLVAMIEWLVAHGADVTLTNRTGFTPLHHAAESGKVEAARALLAAGADPEARLPSGSTPLMIARQRGHAAVVALLSDRPPARRAGAAGLYRDEQGHEYTVMDLSDQAGGAELLALLRMDDGWARLLRAGPAGWSYGRTWDRPQDAVGAVTSRGPILIDSGPAGRRALRRVALAEEEIRFSSRGIALAGTITLPSSPGPAPAVVMIAGSGPLSRKTTRYIGDWLSAHGFVVLTYDKPGTGASGGTLDVLGHDDWATDVRAAIGLLARHPRVDIGRIGLVAASEGGFIAPRVARDDPRVAFVLCRVCSALPHLDAILDTEDDRLRRAGASAEEISEALSFLRVRGEVALGREDHARAQALLRATESASWRRFYQDGQLVVPPPDAPYWAAYRSLIEGDPVSIYPRRRLLVHYLWGADDRRVRPTKQAPAVARLNELGPVRATAETIACADHSLLLSCRPDGIPGFEPSAHRRMLEWLRQAAGLAP